MTIFNGFFYNRYLYILFSIYYKKTAQSDTNSVWENKFYRVHF